MSTIIPVLLFLLIENSNAWLNFSYSAQNALDAVNTNEFSYTICIGDTMSYIHFDYESANDPGFSWLSVALGTTRPHIGGLNQASTDFPDGRYGFVDAAKNSEQGADAIIWGTYQGSFAKCKSVYDIDGYGGYPPYVFEHELNECTASFTGLETDWQGPKINDCDTKPNRTCAQWLEEVSTFDATSASITISRNNIEGDPAHTYQFDPAEKTILAQWAYTSDAIYCYLYEHHHNTRGSMVHHFPTQTSADVKTLSKTLLTDRISGESSGVSLALTMDATTQKVTVEIWGPSDRWFGIGWGGHSEGDALIYTTGGSPGNYGTYSKALGLYDYAVYGFEIDEHGNRENEGIYPDDAHNGEQSWVQLDTTDDGTTVYVKVERALISSDTPTSTQVRKDVDFNIKDDSMIFFVATSNAAGHGLTYHYDQYWIAEVSFSASGNVGSPQTWQEAQTTDGNNVHCNVYTASPTQAPTKQPSAPPTKYEVGTPSRSPSQYTSNPTDQPSKSPSKAPSKAPSKSPSETPSEQPSIAPLPESSSGAFSIDLSIALLVGISVLIFMRSF